MNLFLKQKQLLISVSILEKRFTLNQDFLQIYAQHCNEVHEKSNKKPSNGNLS